MSLVFNPNAISEFARYYGFHYDRIDTASLVDEVIFEMERGLKGQLSSLPMIPAYISPLVGKIPGKTVIALDAGGTNLRSALVRFDENGKAIIEESLRAPMPGIGGQISAAVFFDKIAALTAPLIEHAKDKVEGIGFCFSYAMKITEEADGILLAFSKEVDVPEVIGKSIGAGLRDALIRCNVKPPERIVLLNDTVATLLSGLTELPAHGGLRRGDDHYGVEAGPVVGCILGTGYNTAYPETSIPKIGFNSPDNPQIVVCESGNYRHHYLGILDSEYDSTTKAPGAYTMEKVTSGAYLGPLSFHFLKQAVREGLFTFAKADEFLSWPTLQTKDLNAFMHEPLARSGPVGELFALDERDALASFVYLTSIVTERGAIVSAAVLAAAVEKAGAGFDPFVPVRVAVEGTTYMVYKGMRSAMESHLHVMLNRRKPRSYTIAPVEQASLLGAAVAALSSSVK